MKLHATSKAPGCPEALAIQEEKPTVPIGFGLALSANTAAMNHYAHLSQTQKQDILNRAHNIRSEKEIYALVASLANGTMQ